MYGLVLWGVKMLQRRPIMQSMDLQSLPIVARPVFCAELSLPAHSCRVGQTESQLLHAESVSVGSVASAHCAALSKLLPIYNVGEFSLNVNGVHSMDPSNMIRTGGKIIENW